MNPKYAKNTRNFNKKLQCGEWKGSDDPPIFLIPRQRGGPSYKKYKLIGANASDLHYALISKGFGMQDVSSFTLGPVVAEGLCIVNAAFSKLICVEHIEGGGRVDLSRKNFWRRVSKPDRSIKVINNLQMMVDGSIVDIKSWLKTNENLWLDEWEKWRKSVALCSLGDFHWTDNSDTVSYRHKGEYLNFVEWKKECYIRPAYELLPTVPAYQFLEELRKARRPLGLVHPKAFEEESIAPITQKYIIDLFNSPDVMCCMPFVVAAKLLGVKI